MICYTIAATQKMLANSFSIFGTDYAAMPLFEIVEAILDFQKSFSKVELQEMLRG